MRQDFEAGQLRKFVDEWCKLTSDPFILDIVKHCHLGIEEQNITHLFSEEVEYRFNDDEKVIMNKEIDNLLRLKVIKETHKQECQIISPVFLRKKKDGGYRMVINLKKLNTFMNPIHFKMENFEQAIRLISAGAFMASVDLKHAYYSVKIADEQQKYLSFKWAGKIYQFTCLANGVSEGPRLFTKLMKPVFSFLRLKGYTITSFIDDTLMCSKSVEGCVACLKDTVEILQNVGFCINVDKSVLVPTTRIEYLGNIIDSEAMTVTLPARRVEKIVNSCSSLASRNKAKIREVARVVGLLVAAIPAVELGKLHYRILERAKIVALKVEKGNFDKHMTISKEMKMELSWWISEVGTQSRRIFRPAPSVEVFTDASDLGWGGCVLKHSTNGKWTSEESCLHINAKELKAILFTLQSFSHLLKGCHAKVMSDNTTAIAYVNEMGGTKSVVCNSISIDIWNWCISNDIWITCVHIPGKNNVLADAASRNFNDRHEWKLNPEIFSKLCVVFGTPSIDLFASRLNKQLDCFCSWTPDPEAEHMDAFTLNWAFFDLIYLFPPFSLITRCLQKIREERAQGWIIVPMWTSQPWMGSLLQMLVGAPRLITQKTNVLRHPSSAEEHPIMTHTKLMACLLSGNSLEGEVYRRKVQRLSWHRGDQVRCDNTDPTLTDGHHFVIDGISIPLIPL